MFPEKKEPLMTSAEMRALELNAQYYGVSRLQLMENAGKAVAEEIASRNKSNKLVTFYCGLGGKGGDGFVAARHLTTIGCPVKVILAGKAKEITDPESLQNLNSLQQLSEDFLIYEAYDSSLIPENVQQSGVIVDALLGTGAKGPMRAPFPQLVRTINSLKGLHFSIDLPTGVDPSSGHMDNDAVRADVTVTFQSAKTCHVKATKYCGQLVVRQIGIPPEFQNYVGPGDVSLAIRSRASQSHKGDFGRLLIVGGSSVYSGAPTLVALGALRTGVDLAHVAAPERTAYSISSMSPDLITIKLEGECLSLSHLAVLEPYIKTADALAVGPGLGLSAKTKMAVEKLMELVKKLRKPLLLDADGLKAFAEFENPFRSPAVLTPHAGEYATLTGEKLPNNMQDKKVHIMQTAKKLNAVLLVKGAMDIVSDGRRCKFNFTGNPGMTAGGTGDVLSGIVAGFLAQHVGPFEAACAAAFVNGAAGDFVAQEKGYHMTASDLIQWIPHVLSDPMSHQQVRRPFVRPS